VTSSEFGWQRHCCRARNKATEHHASGKLPT